MVERTVTSPLSIWAAEGKKGRSSPLGAPQFDRAVRKIQRFLNDPATTELNLSGLYLPTLPPIFEQACVADRLETFSCDANPLGSLPSDLARLSRLRHLSCRGTQLEELPSWIGELTSLETLDCGTNYLSALPTGLGRLTNLQSLLCGHNELTAFPAELQSLTQLRALYCQANRLKDLPPVMQHFRQLTHFCCAGNALQSLPHWIDAFERLQVLDVSSNPLASIPDTLCRFGELRALTLANRPLSSGVVPLSLLDLPSGCILDLRGCFLWESIRAKLEERTKAPDYHGPITLLPDSCAVEQHKDGDKSFSP
jgi:Leucine-rich repeat (LRR) protein